MPVRELPVKCDNGHFYLTPAGQMNIGTGIRMSLRSVRHGPCPACGADGQVEDGSYCVPASFRQRLRMAWTVLRKGYV